jgi:Fe2+ transport system protein FeoA
MYKELLVFDFDGTLALTPTPVEGKEMYFRKTGQRWPYQGWWGRAESLEPPLEVTPGPAFSSYLEHREREDCVRVMMTGRVYKLSRTVKERLMDMGVRETCFHELVFKKGMEDTLNFKCEELRRMIREYKPEKVRIWEDRIKHAEGFREFFKSEYANVCEFEVYQVEPSNDF